MPFIPINDLARHTATLRSEFAEACERVIASGWFVLGSECAAFEREFAHYNGSRHCIGVGNGTDALELALKVCGIGPGSRVATVANAGFYASSAILGLGAEPVYIDVSPDDRLMDLTLLKKVVQREPLHAIVITHLFGLMHHMAEIRPIADRAGIPLIEDCAQAHGALRLGKFAGSVGDVGCFSFYPTKNLGALGDGGALITDDDSIAERLKALRQYGWGSKYRVGVPGGQNTRLDELQAALLRIKLPHLDSWNERRRAIARHYSDHICHPRIRCPPRGGPDYVGHLYVIQTSDRADLEAHLKANGIGCDIHYPIPDHHQAIRLASPVPALPVTEHLAQTVLTLPCFPELTDEEIDLIVRRVNAW